MHNPLTFFICDRTAHIRGLLLLAPFFISGAVHAQLTTGVVEGHLVTADGSPAENAPLMITGGAGFRLTIRTRADGAFSVTLPYGTYRFSDLPVFVAPLQTTSLELTTGASGKAEVRAASGLWHDSTRARVYPEPFGLPAILLSREPRTVTEPLDFTGESDNRLWLQSQRAISWTATQFKLQGIDATDSYQPGRPVILPNVEALDEVAVRSSFSQTSSGSYGSEIGLFLREPGSSWHGSLTSSNTGGPLVSSTLPALDRRGLVQQSNTFHWFTRDGLDVGGPVTRWADIFASASGEWSSQTVPLAAPGNDQSSRLLFANVRGRVRASAHDQIEGSYVGSRIDLSDWGIPLGIENLAGNRIGPGFVLPGGLPDTFEVDHLDFAQAGWTREWSEASGLGTLEVRYGYSTAHLDGEWTHRYTVAAQSRIDLLDGIVSGAPPLLNFAIRRRHSLQAGWQPTSLRTGWARHQIVAGGGWSEASPTNRFANSSNPVLITANGAPAFDVRFTPPVTTVEKLHASSVYIVDHISLPAAWTFDVGVLGDFSAGSSIHWNSVSPRVAFAWRVPHAHGLTLRGTYFRLEAPLAGRYLDFGNPNSLSGAEYAWIDGNSDGVFQPPEQGPMIMRFGGPYSSIAPSLRRPYSDEFDVAAEMELPHRNFASLHLFRRDDKDRIAALDAGIPANAFTPVTIADPGPDGMAGTFDDQRLTVYQQNPATFGQDRYLLTNPPGLREMYAGVTAEIRGQWRGVMAGASLVAEKSWGPANPGNSAFSNDPGVLGALFLDPNTAINAAGRSFFDRAYIGKIYASYRIPRVGIEVATVADYLDGLPFARQLLVTGLAQGPFVVDATLRGSPEGGDRAEHVTNWNFGLRREFRLPYGSLSGIADVLNTMNAAHAIQENDVTGPSFNRRLPVAIQAPRAIRLGFRYDF